MISTVVLTCITSFGNFVSFFFQPIDNVFIDLIFGTNSTLFSIIFGVGLTVFVIKELTLWAISLG